jgi:hypothetical protein
MRLGRPGDRRLGARRIGEGMNVNGLAAIVTGGGSGLGAATGRALAAAGARVVAKGGPVCYAIVSLAPSLWGGPAIVKAPRIRRRQSAPMSASSIAAKGPGPIPANSTMRRPASGPP